MPGRGASLMRTSGSSHNCLPSSPSRAVRLFPDLTRRIPGEVRTYQEMFLGKSFFQLNFSVCAASGGAEKNDAHNRAAERKHTLRFKVTPKCGMRNRWSNSRAEQ